MTVPSTAAAPIPGPINDDDPYIFTTARWDPALVQSEPNTAASCNCPCPFYMFEHHYARLQVAKWGMTTFDSPEPQKKLGSPSSILHGLLGSVQQWQKSHPNETPESLRIKLRSYPNGRMSTEIFSIPRIPLGNLFPSTLDLAEYDDKVNWTVVLDTEPTAPTEVTMFKTSDRSCYDRARVAGKISSPAEMKEVLLYTPDEQILDGSITTPYFYRGGKWVTPAANCGGQQGTTRRWSLEKGLAIEGVIAIDELMDGETIWLSNAVKGYFRATFVARKKFTVIRTWN